MYLPEIDDNDVGVYQYYNDNKDSMSSSDIKALFGKGGFRYSNGNM